MLSGTHMRRAGISILFIAPMLFWLAEAHLDGLTRFVTLLLVLLAITLAAALVISELLDVVGRSRDRGRLMHATFGGGAARTRLRCSMCRATVVRIGTLELCPTCDRGA